MRLIFRPSGPIHYHSWIDRACSWKGIDVTCYLQLPASACMNQRINPITVVVVVCLTAVSLFAVERPEVADAAMKGNQALLRKLLEQKADVNQPQIDGATALHWALYRI